jgi:putative flavoprotein involved in K+ transport
VTQAAVLTNLDHAAAGQLAGAWLDRFSTALDARRPEDLAQLFRQDAYWRDLVAFSGQVRTIQGRNGVVEHLVGLADRVRPWGFTLSRDHTPPAPQPRGLEEPIEAFLEFETRNTVAKGIVRLVPSDTELGVVACAFMTCAQDLKGFEERVGARRREYAVPHQFSGPNWREHMEELSAFDGRDPEVVVVGAGQNGVSLAACLRLVGVDVLTIEQHDRVGDNWRNRYHSLTLHNLLSVNKLPHMPFPESFPVYLPKDMFGGWLETYASSMELPVWTGTRLVDATQDATSGIWTLRVDQRGQQRTLRTRHVVMATGGGLCVRPNLPHVPGIETFPGPVVHSGDVRDGTQFAGRRALIFGTGTSAHDVAAQLVEHGCAVTMIQRSPTTVISQRCANMFLQLFEERPAEEVDLIFNANSAEITRQGFAALTTICEDLDRELLDGLTRAGFRWDSGIDGGGHFWNFLQKAGGYYINVGTSEMIIDGRIGMVQARDVATFTPDGLELKDGSRIGADVAVMATGYGGQREQVSEIFGGAVADAVGQVWGYGDDGEMRNTWRPTAAEGLWFLSGGIPHARNYGRYVALQIKCRLEGLIRGVELDAPTLWVDETVEA